MEIRELITKIFDKFIGNVTIIYIQKAGKKASRNYRNKKITTWYVELRG